MYDICLVTTHSANWEQQWSYLLSHFPPRQLYHFGELDPRVRPFQSAIEIQSTSELPSQPLVLMAPEHARYLPGLTSILDFERPAECTYMFGSDSAYLTEDMFDRKPDHRVFIPTDSNDDMHSFVAGALTLWNHRHG